MLASQAEIDASAVESSYSILKVFIWAIPILGFIGTVIGIGNAVGGFSTSLKGIQEIALVKDSLGSVTLGLTVAFDTTLLALIVSLLIMFPTSSIQKSEDDLLISVEEYCNENLVSRLHGREVEEATESEQIKEAVSEAMAEHEIELQKWSRQLETIGATVTEQVVKGWETIHGRMQESYESSVRQINEVLSATAEERRAFVNQVKAVQDDQVRRFSEVLVSMSETANRIQQQISSLQDNQVHNVKDVVSALTEDLRALQRQVHEQHRAEAGTLHSMVQQFSEKLQELSQRTGTMQTETIEALRTAGSDQQEMLRRIGEISTSLAEQSQAIQKQMVEADASRQQAAEQLLATFKKERDAATSTVGDHLTKVSEVGNGFVSSLVDCQRKHSEDIEKLVAVQQRVGSNLEYLAKSDSFNRKLDSIGRDLGQLSSVLDRFSSRSGLGRTGESGSGDNTDGLGRRIWQRITGGGRNG
jgi:biopolymer transport protein ExbB/TolQ